MPIDKQYARLRCFHQSSWTNIHQTFSRYRAGYALSECIEIRRLAQGTLMVTDLWHVSGKLAHHIFILCTGMPQEMEGWQRGWLR